MIGIGLDLQSRAFLQSAGGSTPAAAFLPIVGSAPSAMYGMTKLVSAYSGPCLRVRRSDATETDIGFTSLGYIDMAAAVVFANGSELTVSVFYDQSGNGKHATQTTVAKQPLLRPGNAWRGVMQGITFDSFIAFSGGTMAQKYFDIPASVGLSWQANTTLFVTAPRAGYNNNAHIQLGSTATTHTSYFSSPGSTGVSLHFTSGSTASATMLARSNPSVNGWRLGASAVKMYVDDNEFSSAALGVGTATGGYIGNTDALTTFAYRGEGYAYVIYGAELSDADATTLRTALKGIYSLATTAQSAELVLEGDSITEGTGDVYLMNNMRKTYNALSKDIHIYNLAVHGTTAAIERPRRGTKFPAATRSGLAKKIAVYGLGINDIGGGVTASSLWTLNTLPYIQYIISLGYTLLVATLIPRRDNTAGQETERLSYNAMVLANAATQGYIVCDYCSIAPFANQAAASDLTYYTSDGTHPNPTGYIQMSSVLTPIVQAQLP